MLDRIHQITVQLRPSSKASRLLYRGAAFWLTAGFLQVGGLASRGWDWSGPLSFRKPIVFAISMGLILGTIGWTVDQLPDRPRLRGTIAWTLLVSTTIEVGLITAQTWRGRASHFNVLTNGDAAVFAAMGISVAFMSLAIIGTLVWSLIERPADPLRRLAVLSGLALVTTGLGLGQWLIELGNEYVTTTGSVPASVVSGAAGAPKFPHAISFHGIQIFIIAGLALSRSGRSAIWRQNLMRLLVGSYTGVLVFASAQAVSGLAPMSLGLLGMGFAACGIALAASLVLVGRAWFQSPLTGKDERIAVDAKI